MPFPTSLLYEYRVLDMSIFPGSSVNIPNKLPGNAPTVAQSEPTPAPPPDLAQLPDTLDALWAVATTFGRAKLELNHDGSIEANINFNTKSGSYVSAKGKASNAIDAMRKVIKEAAALQAGVVFAND